MKILIAEDDPVSRRILERTLQKLGHECLLARDGEEAWELFATRHAGADVEVVISDWMMPGLDGRELCRRIRAGGSVGLYTYFILLTALDDRENALSGMKAGADDYLPKPLDADLLEARLIAAERVTRLHRDLFRLNQKLWELARRDAMTGLYNRLQLGEDLEGLRRRVDTQGRPGGGAIALCDVDNFKRFNDLYGHLAGDAALRSIAQALRGGGSGNSEEEAPEEWRLRTYRFGGEEFCLLLDTPCLRDAAVVAEDIREGVERLAIPHAANEPSGVVTVSMGVVALAPGDGKDIDALLREADAALYEAKRRGRNRIMPSLLPLPPLLLSPASAPPRDSGYHRLAAPSSDPLEVRE